MDKEKSLIEELNKIGIALSAEKNTAKLLEIILSESMKITSSDGGSLYIREKNETGDILKFRIAKNRSRTFPFKEFTLDLNKNSIAGYVGMTQKPLNLKNVKKIPEDLGLKYNSSFDEKINYKTVNMLVIPMVDYGGELVGILQLINKKKLNDVILGEQDEIENMITDYTKEETHIISSLAAQAGILLERTKLYNDINDLLESFIETMVNTLDARDTTTSGHSKRLGGYAIKFAEVINRVDYGKYKDMFFLKEDIKELYYASLLHDVGKIGIAEGILLKRNKLTEDRMETIRYRFSYLKKNLELRSVLQNLDDEELQILENIDGYFEFVNNINIKNYATEEEIGKINLIASIEFLDLDSNISNLLNEFEIENLTIRCGNLTDDERYQMNIHASSSFEILKGIKWTKDLNLVPEIAGNHHEKIDGSGYPAGKKGEELLIQSKMLAVLDIFEALTAQDRPYKPAMSVSKAVSILEEEVRFNHLDADLVEIFVKEKLYELYKDELNKVIKI